MGLFDKIFKAVPEEDKLTKQEAFAGIAVAMAGADGSIAESEWDGYATICVAFACMTTLLTLLSARCSTRFSAF